MLKLLLLTSALFGWVLDPGTSRPDLETVGFNVDVGLDRLADRECVGDLSQGGHWNRFGIDEEGRLELRDTQGRQTSVVLHTDDIATWVACPTEQPGGDSSLLGDGAQTLGSDQVWTVSGLLPGSYLLAVYAHAACTAGPTQVSILADGVHSACEDRAESARDSWGSMFVVEASQGTLDIVLSPSGPDSEVRLAGLQIQTLGYGRSSLLEVGSQRASLRSQDVAPLSAPSCARLRGWELEPLILLGGPVGTNFNVLQPVRAPIQVPLSMEGWHPDSGPAHAAMQWAGMQFWWQLGARDGALGNPSWLWRD